MKKSLLLPLLLLLALNAFAQKQSSATAEKSPPPNDPTILGDFVAPSLECINGLSANLMPTQLIQLYASDFLKQTSDNATPAHLIQIALRKAGTGTGFPTTSQGIPVVSIAFGCSELGIQPVELWARDLAGNTTVCETFIIIQDNNANCNAGSGNFNLRVCANTPSNDGVEEVQYEFTGFNPNGPFNITKVSDPGESCGLFDVSVGSTVTAKVIKDDNPLNGVTTFDRVLIQKHIDNLEQLNSPYSIIAADINKDGAINDKDITDLTNLILGITNEFPNNTSWRFIPKDYVFPDPSNPFAQPFPEMSTVENLQGLANMEFVAIKVGDVNNTAVGNCSPGVSDFNLRICANTVSNDAVDDVQFNLSGFNSNGAFSVKQVCSSSDPCNLYDVSIGSTVTAMAVKDDNPLNGVTTFDRVLIQKHIDNLEQLNSPYKMIAADINKDGSINDEDIDEMTDLITGLITVFPNNTSWRFIPKDYVFPDPNNPFAQPFPEMSTVENLQSLASMEFVAIKVGDVNNSAIANFTDGVDERNDKKTVRFGQPSPNPTTGDALLPLFLEQAGNVRLEVFDLNGRLCWSEEIAFGKGAQMLEIPASAMPQTGVYVWRVRAGANVQSGKLIRQ